MSRVPPASRDEITPMVPNARIRGLAVFFLRTGLGVTFLVSGVSGYLGGGMGSSAFMLTRGAFGPGGRPVLASGPLAEILTVLPYFQIALGVALIMGFLTTIAVSLALALQLVEPLLELFLLLMTRGQGGGIGQMFGVEMLFSGSRLTLLMLGVVVLWFSPRETNPYSLDAVVFRPDPPEYEGDEVIVQPDRDPASQRLVGKPVEEFVDVLEDHPPTA